MPKGIAKNPKERARKASESLKKRHKQKNWGFQKGNKVGQQFQKGQLAPPTAFKKGEIGWRKNKRPPLSEAHKNKLREVFKGDKNPNWQNGISFEPYTIDWTETLRRAIRERDNYICQLCNQYGNSVHHIDYNKENCSPNNLITLCKSCNSKVNKNREYWSIIFRNK